jgi:hypothetical protein
LYLATITLLLDDSENAPRWPDPTDQSGALHMEFNMEPASARAYRLAQEARASYLPALGARRHGPQDARNAALGSCPLSVLEEHSHFRAASPST